MNLHALPSTSCRYQIASVELQGDDLKSTVLGFDLYLSVWNALVSADRQGASPGLDELLPNLNKEITRTPMEDGIKVFLREVVQEYWSRRSKANGPLRFKSELSLSTIPMVGHLASLRPEGPLEVRIKRSVAGYFLVMSVAFTGGL